MQTARQWLAGQRHRLSAAAAAGVSAFMLLAATSAGVMAAPPPPAGHGGGSIVNPNPRYLYGKNSHPFGASIITWAQRQTEWVYEQPYATNPIFDQTGADAGNLQQGPVWYIPPIQNANLVSSGTRTFSMPAHRAIFLDIGEDVMDYPCLGDPSFAPAPGQSLYNFLLENDLPIMNSVNDLSVTLDGHAMQDVLSYRYISPRVFLLTGNLTLQSTYDSCITGTPQPAIVDGFYMMLKPLAPGHHTLVVYGTNTFGAVKTYTYNITVTASDRGDAPFHFRRAGGMMNGAGMGT